MPHEALDIILASLSNSSYKQYDVALKKWWSFCSNNIDPYRPGIPDIVKFLTLEFKSGAGSGSINSFRSAISLIVGPHVGEDLRVKRLLKGVYNLKPAKPKYNLTWNPQILLDLFNKKSINQELSFKELSKKLISLLAIITAHRMQTFQAIQLQNIEILENKKASAIVSNTFL